MHIDFCIYNFSNIESVIIKILIYNVSFIY
jgi:hypothetical protein